MVDDIVKTTEDLETNVKGLSGKKFIFVKDNDSNRKQMILRDTMRNPIKMPFAPKEIKDFVGENIDEVSVMFNIYERDNVVEIESATFKIDGESKTCWIDREDFVTTGMKHFIKEEMGYDDIVYNHKTKQYDKNKENKRKITKLVEKIFN